MSKHTPEPWYSNGPNNVYGVNLNPYEFRANGEPIPPQTRCIAHIVQGHGMDVGELEANIRLIETAPELLTVLKSISANEAGISMPLELWGRLHAAIAKAEG